MGLSEAEISLYIAKKTAMERERIQANSAAGAPKGRYTTERERR